MSIVFSSQTDLNSFSNIFGDLADTIGIPGFPEPDTKQNGKLSNLEKFRNNVQNSLDKLLGKSKNNSYSYVESGKKEVVGSGGIDGGISSPIEEANVRQIYSQTPQASVVFKKRIFSSLSHLYNSALMDEAEKWLLRATKRLIEYKCSVMAEYERLAKIDKAISVSSDMCTVIPSLISSSIDEYFRKYRSINNLWDTETKAEFTSVRELEKILKAKQPVTVSTFFKDPDIPELSEIGEGSGAFEITTITNLNTNLDIDGGDGSCSVMIEDPYKILFVTEEDIEISIRETAKTNFLFAHKSQLITTMLENAQKADASLSQSRKINGTGEISFSVTMTNSSLSSGVIAIIDSLGFQITENNIDDIPEGYKLTDYEKYLFRTVMSGLREYNQFIRLNILNGINAANNSKEISENMNYVRKRMRLFYLGKSIIQPMDIINIFLSGGTRKSGEGENIENKNILTLEGAFNTAASILSCYKDDGKLNIGPDDELLKYDWERTNKILTFEDYKKLRIMQLSIENPVHVFGGLVEEVNDSFNNGKYYLRINGKSNIHWLKLTRYNTQPSLDQTPGIIYDPFTPFQYEVSTATGLPIGEPILLSENQRILNSECLHYFFDSGSKIGTEVKEIKDLFTDAKITGNRISKVFNHVNGLKYRWKEGINTLAYDKVVGKNQVNNSGTIGYGQLRKDIGQFTTNTAFDGMDSANIISIMVTGKPYDANTFMKSTINSNTFIKNSTLNSQIDYFSSLINFQGNFTKTHGNFIPYKKINIDYDELGKTLLLQQRLVGKSTQIEQLQTQYAQLTDRIANYTGETNIEINKLINTLDVKRKNINEKLNNLYKEFSELQKSSEQLKDNVVRIIGKDIAFELSDAKDKESYRLFGDKLFFSTLRKREDVIFNTDENYLIISDEYDKDYDIQSFITKLKQSASDMWYNGSFQSVYDLCNQVANILNFHFYCNTQGHLVFSPPQYNRTPASVLAAMFSLNNCSGIKIFPDFLTKLFSSREDNIINEVMVSEWRIVKYAALLGKTSVDEIKKTFGVNIIFLKDVEKNELLNVIKADRPYGDNDKNKILENIRKSNINIQSKEKSIFSSTSQYNLFKNLLKNVSNNQFEIKSEDKSKELYKKANDQIAQLTGISTFIGDEYDKVKIGVLRNGTSTPATDINKTIGLISSELSNRSFLLRTLEKIIEQNTEIGEINKSSANIIKNSTYNNIKNLFGSSKGIFNRLIEDDTRDLIGHLSGDRFIIKDEHIFDYDFKERPPDLTVVNVSGDVPIVGKGENGKFANTPQFAAYGVDYDLWRQYGWRAEKQFYVPFLQSAESQCAPYAAMLLSRQRKNIITGNVTIVGNEFYQLGDVVYIAQRQLLYYVTGISHSFSYGDSFKTSLSLNYGHAPGEYIPTPLDVIGKMALSSSKQYSAFSIKREKPNNNLLLGVIKFQDIDMAKKNEKFIMLNGKYGKYNYVTLHNALINANEYITPKDLNNSAKIYILTYTGDENDQTIINRKKAIADWFENPEKPTEIGESVGLSNITVPKQLNNININNYKISSKFIEVKHIRMCLPKGDFNENEIEMIKNMNLTPSQQAFSIDSELKNIVEIRLRFPPSDGWV